MINMRRDLQILPQADSQISGT